MVERATDGDKLPIYGFPHFIFVCHFVFLLKICMYLKKLETRIYTQIKNDFYCLAFCISISNTGRTQITSGRQVEPFENL